MKILSIFIFLLVTAATPLTVPNVLLAGFEDGDRTVGGKLNLNSSGLSCRVDGMQVSTDFARVGTKSIRSIVDSGDALCGLSYRDEFSVFKNNADSTVKDRFYGFSFYPYNWYPAGVVDTKNGLIFQCKSTSQDAYPFVAIHTRPDASGLYTNYVLDIKYSTVVDDATSESETLYILGRVYANQWVDFTLDIDWQYNSSGSVKVYMNGGLVRTVTGQNMNPPFNESAIRYPNGRFGIYQFGWSFGIGTVVQKLAYYDEVKIGTTGTVSDYFVPSTSTESPKGLFKL